MDLFDIVGPVMIGPSSSHTAGAARIGRVTRRLLGRQPDAADVAFHGSFAKTWQGHGTDRAIVGGLLDMNVDDERLRIAPELAEQAGMRVAFRTITLRGAHPNSVVIAASCADGASVTVRAASVGGGAILVESINGMQVGFSGEADTIVIQHRDEPGMIARVSSLIAAFGMNIATMRVFRRDAGGEALMALELDAAPDAALLKALSGIADIVRAAYLPGLK